MTERKPITADLRRWWELHCRTLATPELDEGLDALCGAVDAVHANLEGENESLRRELDRVLGEREESREQHVVGSAFVTITPQIDWMRMADELDVFTQLVRGFAQQMEVDA